MPHATVSTKLTETKAHVITVNVGESAVTIHKGDRAVRVELGQKIAAAMRRRKPKPGVETASEGLRAIREGR
ncbi:MAG: hypothetical protein NTX56_06840 [Proteobacteria bacterium]|nr:hypothetical protein [Pseudomonadota bacterium]